MSFSAHRYAWIGVAGVIVIVVALVATLGIGRAGIGKLSYDGDFAQAGGIRSGDPVQVAGVDVGEVSATRLRGDHVHIVMKVDDSVRLRSDASAEIKLSTLLGRRYIDLSLGDSASPLQGGHIPTTRVPYDLQQTIERGTPIIAGVDADSLGHSVSDLGSQLSGLPDTARETVDSLTEMSRVFTDRSDQITRLIADTDTVTKLVDDRQYQLAVIVGQGQSLAAKIANREQLLTQMLDGVAQLVTQARALGDQDNQRFAALLVNLDTISRGLTKNRDNLRHLLEILPLTARATNNAVGDGPYVNSVLTWGLFPDNWLCLAGAVTGCAQ